MKRIAYIDFLKAFAIATVLLVPGGETVNLNFMLPCFCLGFLCGNREETLVRHRRALGVLAAAVFLALLPFWGGRMTVYMVPTRVLSFSPLAFDLPNLGLSVYRLAVGSATLGIYVVQTFLLEILVHSLSICLPVWKSCLVAPVLATAELFVCFGVVCLARRCKMTRRLFLGEK